jgi:hypothetical protein
VADKTLIEYIRRSLSRGMPIDDVEKRLSGEGWPKGEIEDAISCLSDQTQASRKASGRMWIAIIVSTIILGAGVMIAASFLIFGGFSFSDGNSATPAEAGECDAQPEGVYRAMCYTDLARSKGDVTVCNFLRNTDERKYRDICVREFAVDNENMDMCGLIENTYIREQCEDWITEKAGEA